MEFNCSQRSTVGVEVEFGIVSRETGDLVPAASEVLAELNKGRPGEHPKAKNELFQSTIEIITGICETPAEATADLADTINEIMPLLLARGLGLESTGTHPFAQWDAMRVTPNPRYERLVDRVQWPAYRLLIHGVHVHVGVRSADKAIITTNVAAMYLPIMLALSTSSPFWLGRDTGLASSRTKIFEGLPTTGIPPQLPNWQAFSDLLSALIAAGTIETVREVWWDIRPHPNFGTVEFRMCDGITTLEEVAAVAAVAQGLVTYIDERLDGDEQFTMLPDWVLKENKWRACRFGINCELIIDAAGRTRPMIELLDELLETLAPVCQRLGSTAELDYVHTIIAEGTSTDRQRRLHAQGASMRDIALELVAETDASLARARELARQASAT